MIGVTCGTLGGVCIVIECLARNAAASAALGAGDVWTFVEVSDGVEETSAGVEDTRASSATFSIFLRFFFSFPSFLDSDVLGASVTSVMTASSCSSRLRFFFFFFLSSGGGIKSAYHR